MTRTTRYKIGSGLSPYSPCSDRFVPDGYRNPIPLEDQITSASAVEGLRGIGLDYPYQLNDENRARVGRLLDELGFELATVELGLYPDRKWRLGSLCSPDPGIRREAVEMSKRGLDVASEMGAYDVLLWPGQDGFDYPFQVDYASSWDHLITGIGEIASHRPDVRIAIEYKPKEPRTNSFVRNAGTLLYLIDKVGLPNVGGCIDLGHSLVAGENPGEAAALLAREGKLFQVHVNDNYRDWDHDLIVGSVTFWETLEFLYWIVRSGYEGWYVMDVFPYREDGGEALSLCVANTERLLDAAASLINSGLRELLERADVTSSASLLWDMLFKRIEGGT